MAYSLSDHSSGLLWIHFLASISSCFRIACFVFFFFSSSPFVNFKKMVSLLQVYSFFYPWLLSRCIFVLCFIWAFPIFRLSPFHYQPFLWQLKVFYIIALWMALPGAEYSPPSSWRFLAEGACYFLVNSVHEVLFLHSCSWASLYHTCSH